MLLWPAIYASLGCLIACFPTDPRISTKRSSVFRIPALGTFIYIYYEWPLWTRNFLLGSHGRTVYAYTNIDIDIISFLVQEATIAGFAYLLAAVWLRWHDYAKAATEIVEKRGGDEYLSPQLVGDVQRAFQRWLLSSGVLALGFIYFTSFFWNLVAGYHDERYIVSAFLSHSLWVITWAFMSLPLIGAWNRLRARRLVAISNLIKASSAVPGESEVVSLDSIQKLESLAGIRISLAGAGAAVSLVLPIIQLFMHKN